MACVGDRREDGAGTLDEALSGRSRGHAARGADEELGAQLVFERTQATRERWLDDVQALGGAHHGTLFGDRDDGLELF